MNLCHVPTLRDLLTRHGLTPTKKLGQHFLVSESVVKAILGAILPEIRSVVEVGPGPGVLTSPLSEKVEKLVAFELDPIAVSALAETAPKAQIEFQDALEVDFEEVFASLPPPCALVSNMPYNITGPLLSRFTKVRESYSVAVLMMQREVADRLLAKPGDRELGSASVLIQSRFDVRLLAQVPGGAFFPPPKVQSTVLELIPRRLHWTPAFDAAHEQFARAAFSQPRKTLANNLKSLNIEREVAEAKLAELGLGAQIRPHQIDIPTWELLARWWHDGI